MEEKSKNWVAFLVVAAVIVVGYFAFSGGGSEGGNIRVGFIAPLSGDAAVYGEPALKATQLAIDEINDAGGVDGGRMIELIAEDGQCDGFEGANAMQKLVNVDGAKIVFSFCSGESLAAAPIANENEVILFSAASSTPDLTTEGGDYFFRNYPSDATQGTVLADVAYNWNKWENVAVVQENLDYPTGISNAFSAAFVELGGTTTTEGFDSETEDFRTMLTKLRDTNPEALLVSVQTPASAERVLKQVRELGWDVPLMGADVIPTSSIPQDSPELVEGMIVAEFGYDAETEGFKAFMEAYMAAYGEAVEYLNYAQTEYDAPYIIAAALDAVGEDAPAIREYLLNMEAYEGISGPTTFDENGDRATGAHKPEVIRGGEIIPLTATEDQE